MRWRGLAAVALAGASIVVPAGGSRGAATPKGCDASRAEPRYTNGDRSVPKVALTFDDGPERNTSAILDVLAAKGAKATFFSVGQLVAGREQLLQRELAEGHMIGDHTFTHADVAPADATARSEIDKGRAAIETATGFRTCLFRAPFLSESQALYDYVRSVGMTTIGVDTDTKDWHIKIGVKKIVQRVLKGSGGAAAGSIVLLHEDYSSDSTLEALPKIIDGLRARGLALVTVTDLLGIPLTYG
jgi:peptidoglycan/xylan/chitin deacetylase (PgdA/CDA1 family)